MCTGKPRNSKPTEALDLLQKAKRHYDKYKVEGEYLSSHLLDSNVHTGFASVVDVSVDCSEIERGMKMGKNTEHVKTHLF